ncbi:M48 family metallopeptidase [Croceibacterium mercuriale]|uniref:M48 family metallopeptidase n=1 Tax=Croceibacterium mercuriale TaxID=1572751 RepID=UPI00126A2052|nr:M48 family metallopeptidase [Croceibacterium mercuriale]
MKTKTVSFCKVVLLTAAIATTVPLQAQFNLGNALNSVKKIADAVTVSDGEIVAMFGQMSDEMDRMNPVAPPDDPYAQRLAALTAGLDNYDGLNLDIKAYRVADVNAFAMGDGTVRVMAGLMDGFEDNEIQCVIGHEIGHVKLEHSVKRMKSALQQDAALSIASTASGDVRQLADSELGKLVGQVIDAQYSQADETAADDYALTFMRNNNYDVQGCPSAMDKLAALSGGAGGVALLQTHPSPQTRARRMRRQLD